MLTQDNSSYSTQAFTPKLNQNDIEVETCINYSPHADVHVCQRGIAEVKISLPTRPAFR